ncbi:GntR family transcriptional regulator [Microbacterium sp. YY-03]|uniref:GntR family transcriptional regulator n=1 Tax=Microbacterium sp. YY-03 TaxID=3421636 RepID=UPI003D167176
MNERQSARDSALSGLPVYRRIAAELWQEIQDGTLPAGTRLPNENELAARFGVTRLTLRQGIVELQRLGAVEIRRGVGTFVTSPPDLVEIVSSLPVARQSSDSLADALDLSLPPVSARPVRQVDEVVLHAGPATEPLPDDIVAGLGVPLAELRRLDTVMIHGGRRWITNSYWYPERLGDVEALVAEHGLVVRGLVEGLGLELRYLWRAFSAVGADFADADALGVPTGTALLVRDGVTADTAGRPVFYVRRRLRGDEAKFVLRYDTESVTPDDDL